MQQLLLWNNTNYAATLSNTFGKENIITNGADLAVALQQPEKFSSLIVLCELNWAMKGEATNRQQLHGIEIVKELRRKYELKIPVLFVSFHSLADIFNAEREILTAVGHKFYQLPATPQDFITTLKQKFFSNGTWRKLSVMELNDIKSFYCSKEGILSQELHSLSEYEGKIVTEENKSGLQKELKNFIKKIYALFLADSDNAISSFNTHWSLLKEGDNLIEIVSKVRKFGEELLITYTDNANNIDSQKPLKKYRWKILLLDDQINEEHELVKQMKANNITVICVNNAADATIILKKDWKIDNSIMVVIADYRLYEVVGGVKQHQEIQGYEFLKEIASTDHLIRLVAFSGLQRKFLFDSFKHYNIRTEVKSKNDYIRTKETRQIFCEEIKELAEENLGAIEAMPSNSIAFRNTLEEAYRELRMHPDYNKMESHISLTAKEYVWEIQKQINEGVEIQIGAIENIKSPFTKKKDIPEDYFKRFNNYLIARRIALWLQAHCKRELKEINNNIIAKILVDRTDYKPTDCRAVVNTNLGLSLADFPKSITIEEKSWLQYEMQLEVFRDIQYIDSALIKIAEYFQSFIQSEKDFQKKIIKNCLTFIVKFDKKKIEKITEERYLINFGKDFLPKLTTPTDVRILFQFIFDYYETEKGKEEGWKIVLPLVSKLRMALFEIRSNVLYQKKLFDYFNNEYRKLSKEKTVLKNVETKITDKSDFEDKSASSINQVFENVYNLCLNNLPPIATDKADVFTVWCIAHEYVIEKKGVVILHDKIKFFLLLTKAINEQNKSLGNSLDEGRISSDAPTDDYADDDSCKDSDDIADDFSEPTDEEDLD